MRTECTVLPSTDVEAWRAPMTLLHGNAALASRVLAPLPRPALHRGGARPGAPLMDPELARRNLRFGWALFLLFWLLFAGTVIIAVLYLQLDDLCARPKSASADFGRADVNGSRRFSRSGRALSFTGGGLLKSRTRGADMGCDACGPLRLSSPWPSSAPSSHLRSGGASRLRPRVCAASSCGRTRRPRTPSRARRRSHGAQFAALPATSSSSRRAGRSTGARSLVERRVRRRLG